MFKQCKLYVKHPLSSIRLFAAALVSLLQLSLWYTNQYLLQGGCYKKIWQCFQPSARHLITIGKHQTICKKDTFMNIETIRFSNPNASIRLSPSQLLALHLSKPCLNDLCEPTPGNIFDFYTFDKENANDADVIVASLQRPVYKSYRTWGWISHLEV